MSLSRFKAHNIRSSGFFSLHVNNSEVETQISDQFHSSATPEMVPSNMEMDNSLLLDKLGLPYTSVEYYYQVGSIEYLQGWVLHLSVVRSQFFELVHFILPVLISQKLPFKIIRNTQLADCMLEGLLGSHYLGKMIAIYPPDSQQAAILAKQLIDLTKHFKGQAIFTDRHLGSIVYTQFETTTAGLTGSWSQDVAWPFKELTPADPPKRSKLLNRKFYPISTIKKDAKGDVIKALYFKSTFKIRTCIIKQGHQYSLYDAASRDITDRLKWQFELGTILNSKVRIPKMLEYFEEDRDAYLAMEFIRGISFTNVLVNFYKWNAWNDLKKTAQIRLVDYLIQIISMIDCLHAQGFIHRDITPENFLLDAQDNFWLIDVELMYSVNRQEPIPPYTLGTPGFTSPEQYRSAIPTAKEDIYALGALMISTFTSLPPTKFDTTDIQVLKSNLYFLINDNQIVNLMANCLQKDPAIRPTLMEIKNILGCFQEQQRTAQSSLHQNDFMVKLDQQRLSNIIKSALYELSHPSILSEESHWMSFRSTEENEVGNEQVGTTLYGGWYTGMAGPLWIIAIAQNSNFNIENTKTAYQQSWNYLKHQFSSSKEVDFTLYSGRAGVALALAEGIRSNLLSVELFDDTSLSKCFTKDVTDLTLSKGISGQGISLLRVAHLLPKRYVQEHLNIYIGVLLNNQLKDGSWTLGKLPNKKNNIHLSLDYGIPGIILFLLHYLEEYADNAVKISVEKALKWLMKKAEYKGKDHYTWPLVNDSRTTTYWNIGRGIPGITLVLIKAYEVLGDETYRIVAESNLNSLPRRAILTNFTLEKGLAGIGEIYLEAYRVFKNAEWKVRAEWIAQFFICTTHFHSTGEGYWIIENESVTTADLFTGNAGIIHFLMRALDPNNINHPLSVPKSMTNN